MSPDNRLRQACEMWLQRAIRFLGDKEVPLSETEKASSFTPDGQGWQVGTISVPNYGRLIREHATELAALPIPEIDALLGTLPDVAILAERETAPVPFQSPTGPAIRMPRHLLADFLRVYLDGTQSVIFDHAQFARSYAKLEQFLFERESIILEWLAGLCNLQFETDPLILQPGITLRTTTLDERARIVEGAASMGLGLLVDVPTAVIEVRRAFGQRDDTTSATRALSDAARATEQACLTTLRIIAPHAVGPGPQLFRSDNPFFRLFGSGSYPYPPPRIPGGEPYVVTPTIAQAVCELWPKVRRPTTDPRIALAVRRLHDSYERAQPEDKLIDYWIGLEALFASDSTQELRYRAALRIARYLGVSAEERQRFFAEIRDSYDLRSTVVHGGNLDAKSKRWKQPPRQLLPAVTEQTGNALRRALHLSLEHGVAPDLQALDLAALT